MPPLTLAYVTPEALRWARESSGLSVVEAAKRIGIRWSLLERAEEGNDLLTLREAEKAADAYERPLAALFLPTPPQEEPQETQFRRLPGAPEPPWPPEMQLLARRVRDRQEAAAELYEVLEEEPPWRSAAQSFAVADHGILPSIVRDRLGVGADEQASWRGRGFDALRAWVDAVEALGVLVMQDGSMPVGLMRGFASTHDSVPAIIVNSKDDPRARAFTVIHELGHLILAANGVATGPATETWCNDFAGAVLMPRDRLDEVIGPSEAPTTLGVIERVARAFTVTPLAAAVRVARAGLIPKPEVDRVIGFIRSRGDDEEDDDDRRRGGNYYWREIGRFGPAYIRLVFSALDNQAVTYPTASALLGNVKVNNFEKLRDYLDRRTERG